MTAKDMLLEILSKMNSIEKRIDAVVSYMESIDRTLTFLEEKVMEYEKDKVQKSMRET